MKTELEEPPGTRRPPQPWSDVPPEQWNDWRWQLTHRLRNVDDFARVIRLTESEEAGLTFPGRFRVEVTPYFASLMDPEDPNCPIRRQVVPTDQEMVPFEA